MRVGTIVATAAVAGTLAAACGGGSSSSTGLNDPPRLSSAVKTQTQHQLDTGSADEPVGTKVTSVNCVRGRQFNWTCDVRLDNGQARTLQVMTFPSGKSYVITSGAF
jgi:hypothetical protein